MNLLVGQRRGDFWSRTNRPQSAFAPASESQVKCPHSASNTGTIGVRTAGSLDQQHRSRSSFASLHSRLVFCRGISLVFCFHHHLSPPFQSLGGKTNFFLFSPFRFLRTSSRTISFSFLPRNIHTLVSFDSKNRREP